MAHGGGFPLTGETVPPREPLAPLRSPVRPRRTRPPGRYADPCDTPRHLAPDNGQHVTHPRAGRHRDPLGQPMNSPPTVSSPLAPLHATSPRMDTRSPRTAEEENTSGDAVRRASLAGGGGSDPPPRSTSGCGTQRDVRGGAVGAAPRSTSAAVSTQRCGGFNARRGTHDNAPFRASTLRAARRTATRRRATRPRGDAQHGDEEGRPAARSAATVDLARRPRAGGGGGGEGGGPKPEGGGRGAAREGGLARGFQNRAPGSEFLRVRGRLCVVIAEVRRMAARSRRGVVVRLPAGSSSSWEPGLNDPVRLFLFRGETWGSWRSECDRSAAMSVAGDGPRFVSPKRDGVRLSFLRWSAECEACGGVVGSGRRQVREFRLGRVTWLCRKCAQRDERSEVRALAGFVRRVRKGPVAER